MKNMNKTLKKDEYRKFFVSDNYLNFNITEVHNFALNLLEPINLKENILDLGCGKGELLKIIEEKWFDVNLYGIDFLKENIEIASLNVKNAIFICDDILNLSFPKNYFDKIVALGTLSYLSKDDFLKVVKIMNYILKINGKIVIRTNTKINIIGRFLMKIYNKNLKFKSNLYSISFYINIFTNNGFLLENFLSSVDKNYKGVKKIILKFTEPFISSKWFVFRKIRDL